MSEQFGNRPVALLVEDKPELLKAKQNLFNVSGFQAICVRTAAEALREFIATPAVDIVIADINLDSSNRWDVSGVDVAAAIHDMRPGVPIVAVSGQFDSLSQEQTRPFCDSLIKGKNLTLPDYNAKLEQWRDEAIAYRERRTNSSKRAVESLEVDLQVPAVDFEVLREFLPGRRTSKESRPRRSAVASPDEVLREAGWWLQLVQAGRTVGAGTRTELAVLVWLRKEESDHVAVLHGFSFLSCRGEEPADAVEQLLKIMAAYNSGKMPPPPDVSEGERQRLLAHLEAVFAAAQ